MRLTAIEVETAKGRSEITKLTDGGGLQLVIEQGRKSWRFAYRVGLKQKALSIAPYPKVSLDEARLAAEKARANQGRPRPLRHQARR
jgi:hypothetical protein